MGTRQELGVGLLVLALAMIAALDRPSPPGSIRRVPSGAVQVRACPLAGPAMTGVRCVLLGMRIPINQAAAVDLEVIPGIGPALSRRIVEDRDRRGAFCGADDLQRVPGIGPRRAEVIRDYVVFSP